VSTDIDFACKQLVKALRDHAATLSQVNASDQVVAHMIAEVKTAARSYTDAIFEATGLGNVFAILHDQDDDDEDDEPIEDALRLSVEARWDFVVEDPDALMRHARQRLVESGYDEQEAEEHADSPAGALLELVQLDKWKDDSYVEQGVVPSGQGSTTYRIEKTLFEMDYAERSEAGF
jgi:hypothetical protein